MIRRLVALVLVLALAGVLLVLLWPQLLDWQRMPVVAHGVALRGAAVAVAVVLVVVLFVVGLAARRARPLTSSAAVLLLVFAAVQTGIVGVRGIGRDDFSEPVPSDVTVLAWNTLGGAPGAERIAQVAIDHEADVVALPETDAQTAEAVAALMAEQGRSMWSHTRDGRAPTSILVDTALGEYRPATTEDGTTELDPTPGMPTLVVVPTSGSGPTFVAAHPISPVPGRIDDWRTGLGALAELCRDGDADVVVAGDVNATLDHMAGLGIGRGALGRCRDAAVGTANGSVGTWPTDLPPLLGAPIDHVLATAQWLPTGFRVLTDVDDSGSDHRPVVAQLSRTGA
ncbi:endonuclease/exonuclease/phosphatase family protein [Frigoribacterium salinisoli]